MNQQTQSCCCHQAAAVPQTTAPSAAKKTARSAGSVLLSFLIAFFPKCPMCLAAYLSMFGSVSMAQAKYMSWLYPVLVCFLGLHLFLIYRKASQRGYGPFFLSAAGAAFILSGRILFPLNNWILMSGMFCILTGSLWNSFSPKKLQTQTS